MSVRVTFAGDTMLGRAVADRLARDPHWRLLDDAVADTLSAADLVVANLECCVSDRGAPWPGKRFHFRAPPMAAGLLARLGVGCVTLANNHAMDYGPGALLDTAEHLGAAGVLCVGAGATEAAARAPAVVEVDGLSIGLLGVTDHPAEFAAGHRSPGVAYADLEASTPRWLTDRVGSLAADVDVVVVTVHWGPNMTTEPLPYVRRAAAALRDAGADLVVGHSAHVFHGVSGAILYDIGDFVDDYATDPMLRNDLGLLWTVEVDRSGPRRAEALPLHIDFCRTGVAAGEDAAWVERRFRAACAAFGTEVGTEGVAEAQRLVVDLGSR